MNSILRSAPVAALALLGFGLTAVAHADETLGTVNGFNLTTKASVTITINANGSLTLASTGAGPYDGSEDTLVDVYNNSSSAVGVLHLTSSTSIFGFDGNDGVGDYTGLAGDAGSLGVGNAFGNGHNSYASPDSYFTNIVGFNTGDVNFVGGISAGGTDYFSLEEDVSGTAQGGPGIGATGGGTGVPDGASTIQLLGGALLVVGALRRRLGIAA